MNGEIQNQVVFITRANRGIGKSLAKAVLAKGASKVYATSRNLKNMKYQISVLGYWLMVRSVSFNSVYSVCCWDWSSRR